MSTVEHATAMLVERSAVSESLLDKQTRIEPFVMLEDDDGRTRVRKLTLAEKLAHSERTGASVFMADEHEHSRRPTPSGVSTYHPSLRIKRHRSSGPGCVRTELR